MAGHHLRVMAGKISPDGTIPVYWEIGKKIGRLDFEPPASLPEPPVLAELAALHHLLVVRGVAGSERAGRNLEITCSFGAIRKVAQGRTRKPHVAAWGRFLRVRFSEARISTRKDLIRKLTDRDIQRTERLPLRQPLEAVPTSLGPVVLTRHAVERFAQRNCLPSLDRAWRHLAGTLRREPVLRTGHRRDGCETWCFGRWRGIVARNGQEQVLKTVIFCAD